MYTRDDWKSLKLAVLEMEYGKQAEVWNDLYPPVSDDRRVYISIEQIHAGYSVCPGSVKYISMDNETPAGGYFVSYMLYKSENRYFSRDRYARLRQNRRNRRNE